MPGRILIVDDDAVMLQALAGMVELRLPTITIDTCESAAVALERIGKTDYDAIVSDVKMPGMDGFQLMERVLTIRPTTPTLLVTGHGDHDMGVKALNAGAYAFIPKPLDRDFFLAWLKRAIQLRQLGRSVEQHTQQLEQIVQERTAQLQQNNLQLRTVAELHRESEARYRSLADAMPQIVYTTHPEGATDYVNQQWAQYTGVSKDKALKLQWAEAVHPDDVATAVEKWNESVRGGAIFETEYRLQRADGEYRWHLSRAVPQRDEHGRIAKWIGTSTDIHDRKSSEEVLRESEDRYKRLVKYSPDAILINRDNRIVFVNEAGLALFGASHRDQLLGKSPFDLFHPDCHPVVTQRIKRLREDGEPFAMTEEQIVRLDGTIVDVEVVASTFLDQGTRAIHVVLRDMTERKRSLERLRESEERLRVATKATNDAIWDWEIETDTVIWNDGVETLFGWTEAARKSQTAAWRMERIHPDDRERIIEGFHAVVEQPYQNHWQDEYRFLKADGDYAHVFDRGYVMRNSHAAAYRVIGSMLDLTERRRAELVAERLQKTEEMLRRAQRAGKAGVWELDLCAGRIVRISWSDAYYDLFALERTIEPSIDTWLDRIHPEDRPRIADEFRHAIENQCDQNMEFRIVHPDGSVRWMHRQGQVERDAQGQAVRISGITVDITERKQAEDLVRDRERFLTTVTGAAHVGLVVVAPGYVYRFANEAYTEILRLPLHDILGRHVYEVIPDGWSQIQPRLDRALAGERVEYELVLPSIDSNGSPEYFEVTYEPHTNADGERTVVVVVVETTARKRAEEQLQRSRDGLRRALDFDEAVMKNMGEGLYTVNSEGLVTYVNPAAEKLFGFSSEELLGRKMHDITHYKHRDGTPFPAEECAGFQVLREGRPLVGHEDVFIRKDGSFFDVVYSSSPIMLDDKITGLVVVFRDVSEQKEREWELRESEERFRTLADHMSQFAWMADATGWISWYNKRWHDYTGTTLEEMQGWGWQNVHHPDHVDRVVEKWRRAHRTGEPWEDTFPLRGKDGHYRWFLSRALPIRDAGGQIVGWFGTNTDINDQRAAEEALRRSEAAVLLFIEQAPTAIAMLDRDMRYVVMSRRWREHYGRGYADLVGRSHYDVHPDLPDRWKAVHRRCLAGAVETCEADRWDTADGKIHWLHWEVHPWRNAAGEIGGIIMLAEDITAERDAQRAVIESEGRFRATFENAAVGIAHVGMDGRWLLMNDRCCAIAGYSREELLGKTFADITHPDDVQADWDQAHRLIAGEIANYSMEKRYIRKDGALVWINLTVGLVRNSDGSPQHFISIIEDIDGRKRAEEEIRRLLDGVQRREHELCNKQEQLVQAAKLASIGELASGVAHELNNPLNNIGLFVGNVLHSVEEGQIDSQRMRYNLQTALQQVDKAAAIITHLRTFARNASTPPEPVDIHGVMRSAASLVEAQLRVHNVHLAFELCSETPVVLGNAIQLEQVFINLLTNARDAVERVTDKRITIRSAIRDAHVDVTVTDTGAGIEPEYHARIFDPFFTTKEIGKGTGLGLSISYGIIKDHQGTITVDSEFNKGTTFTITLPTLQESAEF